MLELSDVILSILKEAMKREKQTGLSVAEDPKTEATQVKELVSFIFKHVPKPVLVPKPDYMKQQIEQLKKIEMNKMNPASMRKAQRDGALSSAKS